MNQNNLLPVSKEGWSFVGYSISAFIIFWILDLEFFQFFSFIAILFFLFVFRNPERQTPNYKEQSVVSPVDGTVELIEEIVDAYYSHKIEIKSSYFDVSVLRAPMNSSLCSIRKENGARLPSSSNLSKLINEKAELVFEDPNANKIKISHLSLQNFDEIKLDAIKAQNFSQGSRYGVMLKGITTIYLPKDFKLNISVGNEISGSQTLIGYFS